ncbi:MAG TPA: GNAT family N-acetyltransferase [Acidimicrobiia bacterium]|nr:GNAT family N-acetyltransferase [Acidimicrobiia bacterium]
MQSKSYLARPYRGSEDLPGMVEVINRRMDHDGGEDHASVEDMAQQYEHLQRCDPSTDISIVEQDGTIVGYARTTWEDTSEGYRAYWVVAQSLPGHDDVLHDLYDWVESRATEIAASHPAGEKQLMTWADQATPRGELLRKRGYEVCRFGATLVRPDLHDIPDRPLPPGVEVRPVEDAHLRAIWEADVEAFRDHWGYTEQTEEDWEAFLDSPNWDPSLWQVAWADDRVVGQVRSYIDPVENDRFARLRGWTEDISTVREWRRRGIASALICSSLTLLRERGMTEAALGVDTENLSGAHRLYESLGFRRSRIEETYRRPLPPE